MDKSDPNYVRIFDTTLRDGDQCPGASMSPEDKLAIALHLERMGVDIIEAGFPTSSQSDFNSVSEIARRVRGPIICALARAKIPDIDRAFEAIRHAAHPRIHTFIATSRIHLEHKLKMSEEEVLAAIRASVGHARSLVEDVEWSAEDATRSDRTFLHQCIMAAVRAGATTINIPDTVGYAMPDEYAALFKELSEMPEMKGVVLSTHCHNDLGHAVANSLGGALCGARQVECTVNGIGERAGNAALEEIVMALTVRAGLFGLSHGIDTTQLFKASKMVSAATGFPVQYNKAIVGKNAFAHEAGIHQAGVLSHPEAYEIMEPARVGAAKSELVMGRHSGRHGFEAKLKELGYALTSSQLADAFERFMTLANHKKVVSDDDLVALVDDEVAQAADRIKFVGLTISATGHEATASVVLNVDGICYEREADAPGSVDAIVNAIRLIVPHTAELRHYAVDAVTDGADAQAKVTVQLADGERIITGRGAHEDTLVASAHAYVHALNKLAALDARIVHSTGV